MQVETLKKPSSAAFQIAIFAAALFLVSCSERESVKPECASDSECSDQSPCTIKRCENGKCIFIPDHKACGDENPCTDDICSANGCVHLPANDGLKCETPDKCLIEPKCNQGTCTGEVKNCDDGNPCTKDSCDGTTGSCSNIAEKEGTKCDDNDPCTLNDSCWNGACKGEGVCECYSDKDCEQFEDNDLCNGTLVCSADNNCEVDEKTVISCDDSKDTDCMKNLCVKSTGECKMTPANENMPCEDGDPCTKGEKCSSGVCKGGLPFDCCFYDSDCEDFKKCTQNKCNLTTHDCEFPVIGQCCGNCVKEEGEDCDDGDSDEFDGCNTECKLSEFIITDEEGFKGHSMNPSMVVDTNGNYFMLFEVLKGGGKEGIWCQKFDGSAGEYGKPFMVSEFLSEEHNNPHIATFGSNLIAGWFYDKYRKFRLLNGDGVKGGELTVVDPVEMGKPLTQTVFYDRAMEIKELKGKNLALAAWMQDNSSQSEKIPEWNVHYVLLTIGNDGKLALAGNPKSLPSTWKKMMPAVAASSDTFAIVYIAFDPDDPYKYENRIAAIDKDGNLLKESQINEINYGSGLFATADGLFDWKKNLYVSLAPAFTKSGEELNTVLDIVTFDKTASIKSGSYSGFSESGVYFFFGIERLESDFLITYHQVVSDVNITVKYRRMDAELDLLSEAEQLSSTQDFVNIGVSAAPLGGGFFAVWTVTDFNTYNIHGRVVK